MATMPVLAMNGADVTTSSRSGRPVRGRSTAKRDDEELDRRRRGEEPYPPDTGERAAGARNASAGG